MSHEIRYETYPEKVNRRDVKASWDAVVQHEDYQEGASGLFNEIRWLDSEPIADSREEAEETIQRLDRGWYDCLAVRYHPVLRYTPTKREVELREKVAETRKKYAGLRDEIHFADAKSKYIGCPNCGSKLNTKMLCEKLRRNHCPLCGADLRPSTKLKQIAAAEKAHKKSCDALAAEEAKSRAKNKSTEVRWLMKVEYHT